MGMSQMCTGAGDYFRTSKPHSEKLCAVICCLCLQGRGGRGRGRGHQQGGVRQERHEEQVHLQHAQGVGLILWHSVYFNIK